MKFTDLKTVDGVSIADYDGPFYRPRIDGVQAGTLVGIERDWNQSGVSDNVALVMAWHAGNTHNSERFRGTGELYASRTIAYRKHIEIVQAAANAAVQRALVDMNKPA